VGRFRKLADQMGDIQRLAWKEVWLVAEDCSDVLSALPEHRRKQVAAALREDMLDQQGGICPLCDRAIDRNTLGAFHVDHVIPYSYGGGYERTNLQVTHPSCNMKKGDFVDVRDLVPYLERKADELGF